MKTKKIGRPTENPKTTQIAVRFDNDTLKILDECCDMLNINRAEGVRRAVQAMGRCIREKEKEKEKE